MKRKALLAALLSLGCGAVAAGLFALGAFETLELKTLDWRFRLSPQGRPASPDVVIVAIDEKSLLEFKRNGVVWKWPRDFYGALVRYLHKGGARAVAFDVLFSDPDIDRKGTDAEQTDGAFAAAMKEAGNVVLATQLSAGRSLIVGDNALVRPPRLMLGGAAGLEDYANAVLPIEPFQKSAFMVGAVNYSEDRDGILRRLPLFSEYRGKAIPHLGMAAYLTARWISAVEFAGARRLRAGADVIPLDPGGRFLICWYGRGGPRGAFKYYSFADVIASMLQDARGKKPAIAASEFKGKVVIVGASAAGLFDYRSTPFTTDERYPAMEAHATIASNLLQKDFLTRAPGALCLAAVFLFAAAVCCVFLFGSRAYWAILLSLACAGAWAWLAQALFRSRLLWLDLVAPEASLALAFAVSAAASYVVEGRARRRLRTMFSRYLSPVIISEVLEKREEVELGGQEVTGTVFFSDIKDFTSLSEKMRPQEVVAFLNEYFTLITEVILQNNAMLDKYIGDAIMAVFGAPLPSKIHAERACAAALEVQRLLTRAPIALGPGGPAWTTRIGLNTGPMIVGNIGCRSRMDYTAIGDTVNLASRLEGANKIFGTRIVVSEETFKQSGGRFEARELDLIAVKGKRRAVVVYELLGVKGEVADELLTAKRFFEEGLRWYRERAFERAIFEFGKVLSGRPDDGPARLYVGRCKQFLSAPPPADWDGVYHSASK